MSYFGGPTTEPISFKMKETNIVSPKKRLGLEEDYESKMLEDEIWIVVDKKKKEE